MDIIMTERLELKPLELNHAALLLPIWSDEEVVKTTYIHGIHTEKDCQDRIERMVNGGFSRKDIGPYVIFENQNLIGIVGAARDASFEYGLYYHIGKEYWGQGYATEAAKAVVDSAFKIPEIVRVSADALTTNPASSRVLEKIGMKFEGCLRMKFFRNGTFGDFNKYSILRREYN
jgi:RimJ/RimL family protein N-acetyltransferase